MAESDDEIMGVIAFLIRDVVSVAGSVNVLTSLDVVLGANIVEASLYPSFIVGEVLIIPVVVLENEVVVIAFVFFLDTGIVAVWTLDIANSPIKLKVTVEGLTVEVEMSVLRPYVVCSVSKFGDEVSLPDVVGKAVVD